MKLTIKHKICCAIDESNILHEKRFTIVAGMNGVGKSTFTNVLKSNTNKLGHIIDPDLFAKKYGSQLSGGREALKDINNCIEHGIAFTEETTLSGRHIISVIQNAKSHGYTIHLIYIGLDSAQDSIDRVANRVRNGGHDIPSALISRRYTRRFDQLAEVLPLCDSADFYDNHNGYTHIAEYSDNEIRQLVSDYPQWMDQFIQYISE